MAEIGGERGQQPLYVRSLSIPSDQPVNREGMPEVM